MLIAMLLLRLEGKKSEEKSLLVKDPSKSDLKPEYSSAEHSACRRYAELRVHVHEGSGWIPCVSIDPLTDWHDDWAVSDSEGATSEGAAGEADFEFAKDDPQSETVAADPDEEEKLESLSAEMLRLHHKFNHISFGKIRALARLGVVNPKLAKCLSPACLACLYGKMTRQAWRFKPKGAPRNKFFSVSKPGEVVPVDMMHSTSPGLVVQMAGGVTHKHYRYAAVYVDHYSGYGYVHLQKTQTTEETLEGKATFERHCQVFGVTVNHYHADNGIFASKAWKICLMSQGKVSLIQESMHTSNLEWLRGALGNCKKQLELASFMLNIGGKKLSILIFGLMQSEQHALFTTKHQPSK